MLAATCAWCAAAGRSPLVLSNNGSLFRLSAHAVCSAVLLHLLMRSAAVLAPDAGRSSTSPQLWEMAVLQLMPHATMSSLSAWWIVRLHEAPRTRA